jgi:hypothetical protein
MAGKWSFIKLEVKMCEWLRRTFHSTIKGHNAVCGGKQAQSFL